MFTLLSCIFFSPFGTGCAWQPYQARDLSRRDFWSPGSQFFTVTSMAATTSPPHPPVQGHSALPNILHSASKHTPQRSTCPRLVVAFNGYEEKTSVLNRQKHEDKHPSASPCHSESQSLVFLGMFQGALDSDTGNASHPLSSIVV